jgi:hypothetical protein
VRNDKTSWQSIDSFLVGKKEQTAEEKDEAVAHTDRSRDRDREGQQQGGETIHKT